jgi:hypothetical protein
MGAQPDIDLVEELRGASYGLPPEGGVWIERNGDTIPLNVCSRAADEIERRVVDAVLTARAKARQELFSPEGADVTRCRD